MVWSGGWAIYVFMYFNQSFHMHQQVWSLAAFRQRRLGFSSFRVSAATLSSRCGSWKHRRTTTTMTILGRRSITCRNRTRCPSPFRPYSHTPRIVFGWPPWTLSVEVRQVNRRIGSARCKLDRLHLRPKCWSDLWMRHHCTFDGRYVNFITSLNWRVHWRLKIVISLYCFVLTLSVHSLGRDSINQYLQAGLTETSIFTTNC